MWEGRGCYAQARGCEPAVGTEAELMGASWEGGQGLGLQPLKAHYSFSPQPAALQHRPAWLSARGRGDAGLARRRPGPPWVLSPGTMGLLQACQAGIVQRGM